MANSVYQINKGINQSIEFKGLKAQYIWYLGGGVIALLIIFAVPCILLGCPSFHLYRHYPDRRNVTGHPHLWNEQQIWRIWTDESPCP